MTSMRDTGTCEGPCECYKTPHKEKYCTSKWNWRPVAAQPEPEAPQQVNCGHTQPCNCAYLAAPSESRPDKLQAVVDFVKQNMASESVAPTPQQIDKWVSEGLQKLAENQVAQPTPPQVGDKPIYVPLPLNDAEKMLRSRWMGDLDRIPLGKVVEFMQSFAESEVARLTAENQRLTRELGNRSCIHEVNLGQFCARCHDYCDGNQRFMFSEAGEPQGETKS